MTYKSITSLLFGIMALSFLTACAQNNKDFSGRKTVSVLVMAEDEDGASIPRSSTVHKRIISKVKGQLLRQGFTVKDEDSIASDLGMRLYDRMSKRDIVEAVKLMNQSASARNQVRALALVRVMGRSQNLNFANAVNVRLEGEIYDVANNRYIGSFDTPTKKFSAPIDCDLYCAIDVVSRETGPLADDLGSVLSRKLAHFVDDRNIKNDKPTSGSSSVNLTGGDDSYVFNLVGFSTEEALEFMRVMSREFPGYKSHDLIQRSNRQWSYEYRSKASLAKLEKWISILLLDMGYNPDTDVDIRFSNDQFTLNLKSSNMSTPTNNNTGSGRFQ